MHTQHVKFCEYVVFLEGEEAGVVEDDDPDDDGWLVFAVVVSFLPSPSLPLVSVSVVLLDCIGTTEGLSLFRSVWRVVDFLVN